MERIKEAIERAADKRDEHKAPSYAGVPKQQRPFQAISSSGEISDKINYPISYLNTQIHHVDDTWLKKNRVLHGGSEPEIISAYKLLRTQVLQKMNANNWKSLAVISARSGQGSTLTAVNLAISIAMEYRHTTLLADFNLKAPQVHRYFNYEPTIGLSDYLLHDAPVNDMLFNPGIESLVVLPGREAFDDSSERLMSPSVRGLVDDMVHRYKSRLVIFDLPPLLESDDTVAFLDQFDAGLLVVEECKTTKSDILRMSELLGDKPILGTLLNNASG
ncbi:MAG: CpsD/CapB family tyrosine-protein kinase [Pseudomonadales bacterium]|nr:CpsD/CapB family tyrosine-protein kinase [Pseudomonadales bacterium]